MSRGLHQSTMHHSRHPSLTPKLPSFSVIDRLSATPSVSSASQTLAALQLHESPRSSTFCSFLANRYNTFRFNLSPPPKPIIPHSPPPYTHLPPPPPCPSTQPAVKKTTRPRKKSKDISNRRCGNCNTSDTRQWLRGAGDVWLCFSCGLYERKHGCPRPESLCNRPKFKRSSRRGKSKTKAKDNSRQDAPTKFDSSAEGFLRGKRMVQLGDPSALERTTREGRH